MTQPIDPFTFEIVRHRLFRVTEEAAIALENVSGTPITAEGHDLMVSLYRADGALMVGGSGFLYHLTSASQAVKHILASFAEDPGIFADDVYFFNDPFSGALHAPDVFLISPIHWRGELAGFVADFVHVTDIGGIDLGGFCPSARESYQEGFSSQGLKLVERGKIRKDVMQTVLNLVRDPGMVELDLKSLMAANHVAKRRMLKLYHDYGYETVDAVSRQLIERSEALLRSRLLELPDGIWKGRQYYDLPERTMPVLLAMEKRGDALTFDFTGTAKQEDAFGVNCSYWATRGSIFSAVFPLLAYDMVWNDGILRPVEMVAPEGTLVNARRPAPISLATIGMVQVVRNICVTAVSKMLGASERYKTRATGTWAATSMFYQLVARSADGTCTVHFCTDSFAGSGGARSFRDGVDMGGVISSIAARWANAERHEASFPHRFLYRRVVPDSGGPGKFRGGVSHELAITPHDSAAAGFTAVLMPGRGTESPTANGVFGGYPGCNTDSIQFRGCNLEALPRDLASTEAERTERICLGVTEIGPRDALYLRYSGGGGYGDPLDRDPELVLRDVSAGLVTAGPAREVYGVVVDGAEVDVEATQRLRRSLRRDRLGTRVPDSELRPRREIPPSGRRINEYLQVAEVAGEEWIQCIWCGMRLCRAAERWKDHAVARRSSLAVAGPLRNGGDFALLEFFCPGCATALDVDTAYRDDPPLHDRIDRWPRPGDP